MQYLGKLDKEKLGSYKNKILTVDVIITQERIKHIQEHHPGAYEKYNKYIRGIISNPDYVLNDKRNIDTVLFIKMIEDNGKNIQIVIKLNTNVNEKDKKNSILTLWNVKTKTLNQMLRNKEIIWRRLDKQE